MLLESTVFILGHSENSEDESRTIKAGENISIQNWTRQDGSSVIPFFSSLAALQRAIEQECKYMALPAKSLFEITKGTSLVLNPKSQYGKEFFPNEIAALLETGMNQIPQQRITEKETEVLLGQPKNYPKQIVDSLVTLLTKRSNAKTAYLFLMHDASNDAKPHLVIGIEANGNVDQLMHEIGTVAFDSSPDGGPLDLIRVTPGEMGLSEYCIKNVKPFYERIE